MSVHIHNSGHPALLQEKACLAMGVHGEVHGE